MKNYLVAVDLEGVHGVVGAPYAGLSKDQPDYPIAVENATKEINAVTKALFENGAETVAVWDNHGTGVNLDWSKLDSRVVSVYNTWEKPYSRFDFQEKIDFDGVIYIGYHAKAGTANGVLNHTYSSKTIQYYKINGKQVGEFEIDSYVAASRDIPALFISSDDACVGQALELAPHMQSVITKYGTGRNSAEFIEPETVIENIYKGVCAAIQEKPQPVKLTFPCDLEVRFTRMEDAHKALVKLQPVLDVSYGEDAHVVQATVADMAEFELFMWRAV